MQMFIIFSERFSKLYANIISVNCYYVLQWQFSYI